MHPVADALVETHKELEAKTKSALATATAKAAGHAGTLEGEKLWENPGKLRDLGTAAAKLFGWDNAHQQGNTYNTLVLSAEQLEKIRALREPVAYETPGHKGPIRPFPDNPSGPVDGELRITS